MQQVKNTILCTLSLCFLLFSCEEDIQICTTCTYLHPSNGSNVETYKCAHEYLLNMDDWEEDFKAQVRAIGGAWDSLEITCVRDPL